MANAKELVTGKRYIELTKIKPATFYRYMREGKIPYFTIEGKTKKWFDPEIKPEMGVARFQTPRQKI